jgi:hypothetical protein
MNTNTVFWLYKPSILFNKDHITKLFPDKNMSSNEKLNAITRLVIILTVLGYLITQKYKIIITGLVTIVSILFLFMIQRNEEAKKGIVDVKEAFTNMDVYDNKKSEFTQPNVANPLMNVLMTEYTDNPTRMSAAPSYYPEVTKSINNSTKEFIKKNFEDETIGEKLFNDLGDSFGFNQSMRSWYVTPNTKIPNDQGEFLKFCYGDMKSCKDGDDFACSATTSTRWTNK